MRKYKIAWRFFMTAVGLVGGYLAFNDALPARELFAMTAQFNAWGLGFLFAYGSTLLLYDNKPE